MKLDKSVQIWRAASEVKERPHLSFVQFDAKAATLTATNSYIAARVPCEVEDGDESGLIPAAALKEAKGRSLKIADGHATLAVDGGDRRLSDSNSPLAPDISDDARIIAAARAAIRLIEKRRGKKKAAQAFRDVLLSEEAA